MKLIEFIDSFSDEDSCKTHLKKLREAEGIKCAKCGHTEHYWKRDKESWVIIEARLPLFDTTTGLTIPPPPISTVQNQIANVIVEINSDSLMINGNVIEFKNSKKVIKKLIKLNSSSVIRVYFDEGIKYQLYLNYLSEFQNAYIELRNEYAMNKYKTSNYWDLEDDKIREVRGIYPMRIHEVDKTELKEYAP